MADNSLAVNARTAQRGQCSLDAAQCYLQCGTLFTHPAFNNRKGISCILATANFITKNSQQRASFIVLGPEKEASRRAPGIEPWPLDSAVG